MKKGFTLIELLVVVLIIGILASVALPQYTRAVDKSKAIEAWTMGKAFLDRQEIYYLENGYFSDNLEDLELDISCGGKNWTFTAGAGGVVSDTGSAFLQMDGLNSLSGVRLIYNIHHNKSSRGKRYTQCTMSDKCKYVSPCANLVDGGFCENM
ncbi:MAG: prepilin-type N-terminal cleavage/methylation domain-containing protein [Elusimicrobiaceae bacterium]|nr:prepilin-type N-terminal cleavage/methylation domain-containing protein [Elusimicrobiaceae bacterium]